MQTPVRVLMQVSIQTPVRVLMQASMPGPLRASKVPLTAVGAVPAIRGR